MITTPNRSRKNLYPDVTLRCDGKDCDEHHTFPYRTSKGEVSHWAKAHGWRITYKGAGLFSHHCKICERFTVAPASYFDRLSA